VKALKDKIKILLKSVNLYYLKPYNVPRSTLLGIKKLPIKTVIDVGANTGQFAKYIASVFPEAKLFCFEPIPSAFMSLEKWAKESLNQVELFNVALGDSQSKVIMNLHEDHLASSSLLSTTRQNDVLFPQTTNQSQIDVEQTTLDLALSDYTEEFKAGILIKMDVQGFEGKVIAGGSNIIPLASAVILEVSIEQLYEGQSSFLELLSEMNKLGFYYAGNLEQYYHQDDGRTLFLDAIFLRNEQE